MAVQPIRKPASESADQPWRSSLDSLEETLAEAARAITELRLSLEGENAAAAEPAAEQDAPVADEKSERITDFERVWQRLESERKEPAAARVEQDQPNEPGGSGERKEPTAARAEQDQPNEPSGPSESRGSLTDFDRVWQRLERERKETGAARDEQDDVSKPSGPSEPGEPRSVDLARGIYLMTIEDRDASVDLIMLQRGLLTLAPLEDIRLVTYAKGIPVVSLRIEGKLDLERLGEAVGDATGRRCEVIPQDGAKLFLRLTPNDDQEEAA